MREEGGATAREGGGALLERADGEPRARRRRGCCRRAAGRGRATLPLDVTRTLGDLFERTPLDICHVHEPFAPSIAAAALRVSRALNVGSFHAPTERIVATQVARKVVELVLGGSTRAARASRRRRR